MLARGVPGFKCFLINSGVEEFQHVNEKQVREALASWQEWFVPRLVKGAPLTVNDHEAIPKIVYKDEAKGAVIGRIVSALTLLGVVALLVTGWGILRLRRYSPTN